MERKKKTIPGYKVWAEMKQRCDNPHKAQYGYYGGRGIGYCAKWSTFEGFLADMGERPDGMTLDRIDSNKDYCKENCRWADKETQANNRSNNKKVVIHGELIGIRQAARKYGIKPATFWARLNRGWSPTDAATLALCGPGKAPAGPK